MDGVGDNVVGIKDNIVYGIDAVIDVGIDLGIMDGVVDGIDTVP